jgi:hypothetical protein
MLPTVRTRVDRIPHRAGIDRSRQQRIHRARRHPARTETWESLLGSTAIAGLVYRIVRGHVENIRIRRMERDRHHRFALLLAAEGEKWQKYEKAQCQSGAKHHRGGERLNHRGRMGVKDGLFPHHYSSSYPCA